MPDADTEFVQRYEALVERIVRGVEAQLGISRLHSDLVGFGMVGLLEAKQRYDATLGIKFSTFAYYRIRGAVLDGISSMSRLPRGIARRCKALNVMDAESEHAAAAHGNDPSGVDAKQVAVDALGAVLSRTATAYTLALMAAPEHATPEAAMSEQQAHQALSAATEGLGERERRVVRAHYLEDRPFDEIAKELGVSKSWLSRIHARALDQLRVVLTGDDESVDEDADSAGGNIRPS